MADAAGELTRVREVRAFRVLGISSPGDWMGLLAVSTVTASEVAGTVAILRPLRVVDVQPAARGTSPPRPCPRPTADPQSSTPRTTCSGECRFLGVRPPTLTDATAGFTPLASRLVADQ